MQESSSKLGKAIVILTSILAVFGLAILSSAGVIDGQKRFDSAYYYVIHQCIVGVLPGALLFYIFSKINYKHWKVVALPLFLLVLVSMVLVFVPHLGVSINGARRWIHLGMQFQPSEFLKLSLVLYLAAWFSTRERDIGHLSKAVVPLLLILGVMGILLILQPDMGTLSLLVLIAMAMYFLAGAKWSHFGAIILLFGIAALVLALVSPYRFNRVKTFLDPGHDTQGVSYHINQALIGIGSGGVFGRGFGQSVQKVNYLPEPVGDSIFAIAVEELGLVGGVVLLSLFGLLSIAIALVGYRANDSFGRLVALGCAVWLFGQAFVNIAAISGIIPLTGLPLPFVSYGSSSMISIMSGLGIVVNIAES